MDTLTTISTWSFTYHRSPFITHISEYLQDHNIYKIKNIMNNCYAKSLVSVDKYISQQMHKQYIYPLQLNPLHFNESFPNIVQYVIDTFNKQDQLFDGRMCPYFSKCIFKNISLSYHKLLQLNID
jgi:hypothetical protein